MKQDKKASTLYHLAEALSGNPENTRQAGEMFPLLYNQLRRLAAARLAQERPGQTLQATALVHEAWLRIGDSDCQTWRGQHHFIGAVSQAMRRILVENARRKQSLKRGGHFQRVDVADVDLPQPLRAEVLLALDDALNKLGEINPKAVELVHYCFFAGLTQAEAARHLGISTTSAERTWAFARAWLFREVQKELK